MPADDNKRLVCKMCVERELCDALVDWRLNMTHL